MSRVLRRSREHLASPSSLHPPRVTPCVDRQFTRLEKNRAGNYRRADLTDFDLGRTYDVVTCLFSAIAIVRTYARLELAIKSLVRHVRPGGVLIVEPWFAPDQWRPGRSFVLTGEVADKSVYRLS